MAERKAAINAGKSAALGFLGGGAIGGGIAAAISSLDFNIRNLRKQEVKLETKINNIENNLIDNPVSLLSKFNLLSFLYAKFSILLILLFSYANWRADFFWSMLADSLCEFARRSCLLEIKIYALLFFISISLFSFFIVSLKNINNISYVYFLKAINAKKIKVYVAILKAVTRLF